MACRLCQHSDPRDSFAELGLVKSQNFGLISQKLLELRLGQRFGCFRSSVSSTEATGLQICLIRAWYCENISGQNLAVWSSFSTWP